MKYIRFTLVCILFYWFLLTLHLSADAKNSTTEIAETPASYFEFETTKDGKGIIIIITGFSVEQVQSDGTIVIPSKINGLTVVEITKLDLTDGKYILKDDFAFQYCETLKEIMLPSTLKKINSGTFANTAIEKLEIPDSIKKIDFYAFEGCKRLKTLIIPESIEYIGDHAFKNCIFLSFVTLPNKKSGLRIMSLKIA